MWAEVNPDAAAQILFDELAADFPDLEPALTLEQLTASMEFLVPVRSVFEVVGRWAVRSASVAGGAHVGPRAVAHMHA